MGHKSTSLDINVNRIKVTGIKKIAFDRVVDVKKTAYIVFVIEINS